MAIWIFIEFECTDKIQPNRWLKENLLINSTIEALPFNMRYCIKN